MGDITSPNRIFPSSLTFSFFEHNPAKYESQCWRYIQLAKDGPRTDMDERYTQIGEAQEVLHEKSLTVPYDREFSFRRNVTPTSLISGRVDFKFEASIDECKATFSKPKFADAVRGEPDPSHLAQLVCYLLEFNFTHGRLQYGYFEEDAGKLVRSGTCTVEIALDGDSILINGEPSQYLASQLVNSIVQQDKWSQTDEPAPRPVKAGFMGPCSYCPLASLCDRIESEGLGIAESRPTAHTLIAAKTMREPKINKRKKDKK